MADIFREIDEELQQEKVLRLWKQYGKFAIAGAVAIVLGTAGWVIYRDSVKSEHLETADRFFSAVEDARDATPADGLSTLEALSRDAEGGFAWLSSLQAGAAALDSGDRQRALDIYRTMGSNWEIPTLYRELASLKAAQLELNMPEPDLMQIRGQLENLAVDGHPWRYSALETLAVVHLNSGETELARRTLEKLSNDPAAPSGVRSRAEALLDAAGGPVPLTAPKPEDQGQGDAESATDPATQNNNAESPAAAEETPAADTPPSDVQSAK